MEKVLQAFEKEDQYFKWNYLTPSCSKSLTVKQFKIIAAYLAVLSDEIYDAHRGINEMLLVDQDVCFVGRS